MCYHIKPVTADKAQAAFDALFSRPEALDPKKHFTNGFDHPNLNIITNEKRNEFTSALWGLVPEWNQATPKEFYSKSNTLNARIEELHEKRSYKDYTANRCIIPVHSFKEFQHQANSKTKVPYEIVRTDNCVIGLAGIYSIWDGLPTFTIMMTEANELMAEIHNSALRMPVVLNPDEHAAWLNNEIVEEFFDRTKIELTAHRIIPEAPQEQMSLF